MKPLGLTLSILAGAAVVLGGAAARASSLAELGAATSVHGTLSKQSAGSAHAARDTVTKKLASTGKPSKAAGGRDGGKSKSCSGSRPGPRATNGAKGWAAGGAGGKSSWAGGGLAESGKGKDGWSTANSTLPAKAPKRRN